jgi:hypothetical protein
VDQGTAKGYAVECNSTSLPVQKCKGRLQLLIKTVKVHLLRHGRHHLFRVWRGPGIIDSSDEEWEDDFWIPAQSTAAEVDAQVDTREMLHDAFQSTDMEDRVRQEVLQAFTVADDLHEEYSHRLSSSGEDEAEPNEMEEQAGDSNNIDCRLDSNFDSQPLQEALQELYVGARSTKLATTILVMNLCTIHGVSNNFADELFAILHAHILPQ